MATTDFCVWLWWCGRRHVRETRGRRRAGLVQRAQGRPRRPLPGQLRGCRVERRRQARDDDINNNREEERKGKIVKHSSCKKKNKHGLGAVSLKVVWFLVFGFRFVAGSPSHSPPPVHSPVCPPPALTLQVFKNETKCRNRHTHTHTPTLVKTISGLTKKNKQTK